MTTLRPFRPYQELSIPMLAIFLISFIAAGAPRQAVAQETTPEQGTVYIIRRTGLAGALDGYSIFMDGERICVLNNKKYSVHQVPAGKHSFNVRFNGKGDKEKKEHLEIEIEPGREHYITLEQRAGLTTTVTMQELAASTGKRALEDVTRDDSCR